VSYIIFSIIFFGLILKSECELTLTWKENNVTTTSYRGGADWGIYANHGVYADWGYCGDNADYAATYAMLGALVVSRFNEIAHAHGSSACWIPQTSEVIIDINEPTEFIDMFEDWRGQATVEIWEKWENMEIDPIPID
jgi:hypothetical protein